MQPPQILIQCRLNHLTLAAVGLVYTGLALTFRRYAMGVRRRAEG